MVFEILDYNVPLDLPLVALTDRQTNWLMNSQPLTQCENEWKQVRTLQVKSFQILHLKMGMVSGWENLLRNITALY